MDITMVQKSDKRMEYRNKHFHVYSQEIDFGSFSKKYYVTEHGTKASLLVVDNDSVLLARQYRFLVERPMWEIPGGMVEEGEDAAASAVRECEEETGIRVINVRPLIYYPVGMDTVSAVSRIFYATEFSRIREFVPNPAEVDMIKWASLNDCMRMIKKREILDHFSIIALLYFEHLKNTRALD
jgi:8-oxo-dGTP pyrophosphatase MutT (NUDIX family)